MFPSSRVQRFFPRFLSRPLSPSLSLSSRVASRRGIPVALENRKRVFPPDCGTFGEISLESKIRSKKKALDVYIAITVTTNDRVKLGRRRSCSVLAPVPAPSPRGYREKEEMKKKRRFSSIVRFSAWYNAGRTFAVVVSWSREASDPR